MKTHQIISIPESELVPALKEMSLADLEKHAETIMLDMGAKSYAAVMSEVMKAINEEADSNASRFERVQSRLKGALPNQAVMSDIYARLAAIVMRILKQKFDSLYQQSNQSSSKDS